VKDSADRSAAALPRLATRPPPRLGYSLGSLGRVFSGSLSFGTRQLQWIDGALSDTALLAVAASEVDDAEMRQAVSRMAGPRLQAAFFGAVLLATWLDFLTLADEVLRHCPAYSAERLFGDLLRVQRRMESPLTALASMELERVEAAATALPELMEALNGEFEALRRDALRSVEHFERMVVAKQVLEALTLGSTARLLMPPLPPAAPVTLGVGMVMGSGGVMVGTRVVVSAEWVERLRALVQAGVISLPAASVAVSLHARPVLMAQANGDLPRGVREALGDSPEVRAMHETGRAGAGMAEAPRHHVLPREHRAWFEQRGFKGAMDIDQFCVRLEAAKHQAIHGGGSWRLGRMWPGEWNQMIMEALLTAERASGTILTRTTILKIVAREMRRRKIPMNFVPGRGR
jgi:hypothetical protein